MATRQFYSAESTGESAITSGTGVWTQKVALTFTPDANAVYYILASWTMRSNSTTAPYRSRLQQTSNTPVTHNGNYVYTKDGTNYRPAFGVGVYTAPSSPSAETFKIEFQRIMTSGSIYIRDARIVAIKKGANDTHASHDSRETTTSTSFVDSSCTLTFTPGSQGDYIIIAVADMDCGTTFSYKGYVVLDVDGTDYEMGQEKIIQSTDNVLNMGTVRKINLTAASHTLKIQFRTDNSGLNTVGIANKRIIALRVSDFNGEYTSNNNIRATTNSTTLQNFASQSPTLTAGNHLVLGSILYDNASVSSDVLVAFDNNGTALFQGNVETKAADNKYAALILCAQDYTSGSKTIRYRYASENGNTVGVDEATISLLALEASVGNNYTKDCTEAVAIADTTTKQTGKTFSEIIDPVDTYAQVKSVLKTLTEKIAIVPTGRFFMNETMSSPPSVGTLGGDAVHDVDGYVSLAPPGGNKLGTYELTSLDLTAQGRYFEVQFEILFNNLSAGQFFGFYFDYGTTPTSAASAGGRMVYIDPDDDFVSLYTNGSGDSGFGPTEIPASSWTKVRLQISVDTLVYIAGINAWSSVRYATQDGWSIGYTPAGGKFGFIGKTGSTSSDEIGIRNVKVFSTHGAVFQTSKPLSEAITIVDINTKTPVLTRTLNEAVEVADTLQKQGVKTILEILPLADTRLNSPSKTFAESITLAQSYTSLQNKILSQAITIADIRTQQVSKTLSQLIVIADIQNNQLSKNFTESLPVADTLIRASQKTLSEMLAIADTLIRAGSKTFAEAITIAENLERTPVLLRIFTEAVAISETLSSFKVTIEECVEYIGIIEGLIKASSKSFIEVIDPTDTVAKRMGKTFNEVVDPVDTLTKMSSKRLSEVFVFADSIQRITTRTFNESVTLIENLFKGLPSKTYNEVVALVDSLTKSNSRIFNENVTLIEVLTKAGSKQLSETITLVQDFIILSDKIKEFTEAIALVDTQTKQGGKNLTEAVVLIDSLENTATQARVLSEAIAIIDSLTRQSLYSKTLDENVTIVDTQAIVSAINAAICFLYNRSIGYQGVYSSQANLYSNVFGAQNTSYSNVYTNQNTQYETVYDSQSYH